MAKNVAKQANPKRVAYEKKQQEKGEQVIKWIIGVLIVFFRPHQTRLYLQRSRTHRQGAAPWRLWIPDHQGTLDGRRLEPL